MSDSIVSWGRTLEFESKEAFEKMQLTPNQIEHLRWVTYKYDNEHTCVVKGSYGTKPGLYKNWELE
jgi:hypothetical protein